MMSSDILLLVLHKNYCCTWKYILKLIFKGFFLINRCLIFKVRRTRFVSAWILYHTAPQLSTLFFAFFIRFFQLLRVFCGERDFYWVYRNVMEGVFYWGWCFIGLLVYYSFITIPLVLLFLLSQSPAVFSCGSRVRDDVGIVPYRWCDDIVRFQAGEHR